MFVYTIYSLYTNNLYLYTRNIAYLQTLLIVCIQTRNVCIHAFARVYNACIHAFWSVCSFLLRLYNCASTKKSCVYTNNCIFCIHATFECLYTRNALFVYKQQKFVIVSKKGTDKQLQRRNFVCMQTKSGLHANHIQNFTLLMQLSL